MITMDCDNPQYIRQKGSEHCSIAQRNQWGKGKDFLGSKGPWPEAWLSKDTLVVGASDGAAAQRLRRLRLSM